MKHIIYALVLLFITSQVASASEQFTCKKPLSADQQKGLLAKVESKYTTFSDLAATFVQYSYFLGLNKEVTSRGKVLFKKPGMMHWNYLDPEQQSFIADGETLWFYQPELNQVTLGSFQKAFSSELPVSFLLGVGNLSKEFELKSACRTTEGTMIQLSSKSEDPNLQEFYLLVNNKTHAPTGAKIIDVGGNETSIIFRDVAFDVKLDSKDFSFSIPKGVDIIDQRNFGG